MAEPLILAYGRGELPEFPASPDSVVDIVPCDHVVNAILAVCATEPEVGTPRYYHVNSGARNPLTFRDLYGHIRSYFTDHPFEGGVRGVARLPQWQFPGATSVERLLSTSERAHRVVERVLAVAPRSKSTRKFARDLDRARVRLDFLRRYLSLYNEYAQSELHFVDDNTLALTNALHADDQPIFAFDTAVFDWTTYIEEVHCPLDHRPGAPDGRAPPQAGRPAQHHEGPQPRTPPAPRALAIFDLDGTIMSTNVIEQYLWARLPELSPGPSTGRGRPGAAQAALLPAGRTAGSRHVPARGLPALRRRRSGRAGGVRRHHVVRSDPQPAVAGGRPADPGASRSRAHHDLDHRRGPAADPSARAAVRRDRGRGPGHRRRTAAAPASSPGRRWSGSRAPPGCSISPPVTASISTAASPTPTPIPICRCCPRSATRSRSVPTSP